MFHKAMGQLTSQLPSGSCGSPLVPSIAQGLVSPRGKRYSSCKLWEIMSALTFGQKIKIATDLGQIFLLQAPKRGKKSALKWLNTHFLKVKYLQEW